MVYLLKDFYLKRAYRLFPQSWFWLGVILVGAILWPQVFADYSIVIPQVFSAISFLGNFSAIYSEYHPMLHVFWSLSLEEQFYFIFPIALFLFRKKGVIALSIIYLISRTFIIPDPNTAWPFRLDAILSGVLLAFFYQSKLKEILEPTFLKNKVVALAVSILLLLVLVIVPGALWKSPVFFLIQGLFSVAVLFPAIYGKGYSFPLPSHIVRVMDWLGTRSYALYLIHTPAFYIVWRLMPKIPYTSNYPTIIFITCSLLMMSILAELSYRFIEQPLRIKGRKKAALVKQLI